MSKLKGILAKITPGPNVLCMIKIDYYTSKLVPFENGLGYDHSSKQTDFFIQSSLNI